MKFGNLEGRRPRRETERSIARWAAATFGPVTPIRCAIRANEEMAELLRALSVDRTTSPGYAHRAKASAAEEIGDVAIVLFRLAAELGTSVDAQVQRKMRVNRARRWETDGKGVGHHVRARSR